MQFVHSETRHKILEHDTVKTEFPPTSSAPETADDQAPHFANLKFTKAARSDVSARRGALAWTQRQERLVATDGQRRDAPTRVGKSSRSLKNCYVVAIV